MRSNQGSQGGRRFWVNWVGPKFKRETEKILGQEGKAFNMAVEVGVKGEWPGNALLETGKGRRQILSRSSRGGTALSTPRFWPSEAHFGF